MQNHFPKFNKVNKILFNKVTTFKIKILLILKSNNNNIIVMINIIIQIAIKIKVNNMTVIENKTVKCKIMKVNFKIKIKFKMVYNKVKNYI